ncbi:DNA-binding transcriptional MerR regulator [Rhizobium subbaraonis]|uniref:DNA-binding transcriptional MerR regulator n=1 Tax=Rhizobium subbaraonis TaxID=908946 RepID=A0A285U6F6_9HYPH|nr:helix-turn-helix domain-containing protein [Rhizobium subbaraonis]SOC35831.1 DNA-binding transcriptional MerR regulator [Rhizobium subbaraonis]
MERVFSIGKLAAAGGSKVETIRYYEAIGLLPEPERNAGNQRRYSARHYDRLVFILHARDLGLSIEAIRQLIDLSSHPDMPCHDADEIARRQLDDVRQRIARLKLLEAELERTLSDCSHGTIAECKVIETLAQCGACERHHRPPR